MIRSSPIAGSWYEGSKESLENQIRFLFLDEEFGPGKDPVITPDLGLVDEEHCIGLISPHAGYVYSGRIAACGYKLLYENCPEVDTFIVLGPNHRGTGPPISIYPEGKWQFPLGDLEIDEDIIDFIKSMNLSDFEDGLQFEESAHISEHSIDIQFPILQYLYKNKFKIIVICMADQSLPAARNLAVLLFNIINYFKDKKIKVIASSDLSHEYDQDKLYYNDTKMIETFVEGDPDNSNSLRRFLKMTMCGYGPVFTLMTLANLMGDADIELVKYANSADIQPGSNYTVGYASLMVKTKSNL
ncbi:MAG: AmmeMemoRadiSam system protein B [Candidatus Heimdallarchaeota archaeon]|nr:AmmeMemoRadiSam system protein B [Candidatus Heimdallarchaeota archaeon]